VIGNPEVQGWTSLPEAEEEARAVAALFPRAHLLLQRDVSGVDLASEIEKSDVFHFSGHATSTIHSAGLVLNPSEPMNGKDFAMLDKGQNQLIVLSACVSSHGTTGLFDDEDSLVRRLLTAHVPVVVASRWSVNSAATKQLMTGFYSYLLTGKSVSTSLWASARNIRAQPGFSHPYYWAGFSVFGRN
jgi:CHAT domain-containing protein